MRVGGTLPLNSNCAILQGDNVEAETLHGLTSSVDERIAKIISKKRSYIIMDLHL